MTISRVLITGVSGFVGGRAWQRLSRRFEVVGTGRSPGVADPAIDYRQADIGRVEDCRRVCQGVDAILHCAGKSSTWGPYEAFEQANVAATRTLLEGAREAGVQRFINLSSPTIYFAYRDQHDLRETDVPARFVNAYAATKYRAEQLVTEAHSPELATVSLRPRGVIGAGDTSWLPRIIDLRRAGKLVQPGDGHCLADFTSVSNLIEVFETLLGDSTDGFGRTYNITNGRPEKLWHVIEAGLQAVGLDATRRSIPVFLAMGAATAAETLARWRGQTEEPNLQPIKVGIASYSMTLDIGLARKHLGYEPKMPTMDAIAEFADWYRARDR